MEGENYDLTNLRNDLPVWSDESECNFPFPNSTLQQLNGRFRVAPVASMPTARVIQITQLNRKTFIPHLGSNTTDFHNKYPCWTLGFSNSQINVSRHQDLSGKGCKGSVWNNMNVPGHKIVAHGCEETKHQHLQYTIHVCAIPVEVRRWCWTHCTLAMNVSTHTIHKISNIENECGIFTRNTKWVTYRKNVVFLQGTQNEYHRERMWYFHMEQKMSNIENECVIFTWNTKWVTYRMNLVYSPEMHWDDKDYHWMYQLPTPICVWKYYQYCIVYYKCYRALCLQWFYCK